LAVFVRVKLLLTFSLTLMFRCFAWS